MLVFAFDRDRTVDVNPPRDRRAVPLAWVRHLAHETDHEVWAIGNQRLADEADIPGVAEALERHPDRTVDDGPAARVPREERVRLVGELFPDADGYVVVDDVNLSHLDGWTHYFPWDFAAAVERGDADIDLSPRVRRAGEQPTELARLSARVRRLLPW